MEVLLAREAVRREGSRSVKDAKSGTRRTNDGGKTVAELGKDPVRLSRVTADEVAVGSSVEAVSASREEEGHSVSEREKW